MSVTSEDLDAICGLVNDLCGIYLDSSKDYLIEGRLSDLLRRHNCATYAELARRARDVTAPQVKTDIIDAITTNETLWFRDNSPFEALRFKLFPELIDAKAKTIFPRRLRVWSAACSSGQEAYSIAMAFADIVPDIEKWDLQIYGTDISPAIVERAKAGVYSDLEIGRGMDQKHLSGYFVKDPGGWRVCDTLRQKCRFEVRNLLQPFSGLGHFDIIFCRNVAIYFTPTDRRRLFYRLAELLNPEGWLFAGSSESLVDLGPAWAPKQHCRAVCYNPSAAGALVG